MLTRGMLRDALLFEEPIRSKNETGETLVQYRPFQNRKGKVWRCRITQQDATEVEFRGGVAVQATYEVTMPNFPGFYPDLRVRMLPELRVGNITGFRVNYLTQELRFTVEVELTPPVRETR